MRCRELQSNKRVILFVNISSRKKVENACGAVLKATREFETEIKQTDIK